MYLTIQYVKKSLSHLQGIINFFFIFQKEESVIDYVSKKYKMVKHMWSKSDSVEEDKTENCGFVKLEAVSVL